jgi:hypothetical protein
MSPPLFPGAKCQRKEMTPGQNVHGMTGLFGVMSVEQNIQRTELNGAKNSQD